MEGDALNSRNGSAEEGRTEREAGRWAILC